MAKNLDNYEGILVTKLIVGADASVAGTQQTHIADASVAHALNATFSDTEVESALNALGTKINSILAVLEAFGLTASS